MAMKLPTLLAMALAPLFCFASDGCTTATEFQPRLCPANLPRISAIVINENAIKSPVAEPGTDCSSFKLTEQAARRFFSWAWEANESDAHHTLDWSPCYASGVLTFQDGKTARWSISQFRTGSLWLDDERKVFLYCPGCRFTPFLGAD